MSSTTKECIGEKKITEIKKDNNKDGERKYAQEQDVDIIFRFGIGRCLPQLVFRSPETE